MLTTSLAGIALLRGREFRYELVNPAYQAIAPERRFPGRTVAECWPDLFDQVKPLLDGVLDTGIPFHVEDMRFEIARGAPGTRDEVFFTFTYERVAPDARGEAGILVTVVETTHLVQARRRVEEEGDRLRHALSASAGGMWEWDLRTNENVWSDQLWELYGLSRDGRSPSYALWREAIVPEDRERSEQIVGDAAVRGVPFEAEFRVAAPGSIRHLVARGEPVRDASGKVVRFRGVVFDVTAMKRASQALLDKERGDAVQEAVSQLPIGVALVEVDPAGTPRGTGFNEAYREIVGHRPGTPLEFAALPHQLFHPDRKTPLLPEEWPGARAARTGETVKDLELHLRRADGSWRIVSISAAPVGKPVPGAPRRAVALLLDVTEQRSSAEVLAASERRLRRILDHLPGVVALYDEQRRLGYVNRAGTELVGLPLEKMVGRRNEDLVPKAWADAVAPHIEEAFRSGKLQQFELERDGLGGRVTEVVTEIPLADDEGRVRQVVGLTYDVTARKRADELGGLRAAIEALPIGVAVGEYRMDGAPVIVATNRAFDRIAGVTPYEAFRADRVTPIPWQDWPGPRAARTRETIPLEEMHVRTQEGAWRVLRVSAAPVPPGPGGHLRSVVVALDVTDEVTAATERLALETRFRVLVDRLPIGVTEVLPDGGNLYANPAIEAMTGRTAAELRASGWHTAIHPDDRDRLLAAWEQAVKAGRSYEAEYRLLRPDGTVRAVHGLSSVLRAPDGTVRGFLGLIRDVTEEREAAEALRTSEARFRDVVASADEYVFEMDPNGVVTFISDAVLPILGYRPEELVGRSSLELMDDAEREHSGAFLSERVSRHEGFAHFQQTAMHRGGRKVWLDVSAVPMLGPGGILLGYRGTAMDVTFRHEAEAEKGRLQAQLAQAQKMEVVGRLAGGVAHDFNNLLTVILACGLEVRGDVEGGKAPDPGSVDDILAAAQRAAELTRQLLAFARKQVVTPEDVDLNQVIRQTRKLLGRVIGEDVQVTESLASDLRPVRCDPGLLGQVVMNLAVNARDAMPRGGTLALETSNVSVAQGRPGPDPEMPAGDYASLRVRDSGIGMPAEVLAHVFEPFFTTKPVGTGTGLGLATVYGIVKQSGGWVTVDSLPGIGTTFEVFLPALPAVTAPRGVAPEVPAGGTEGILVVEDDPKVRDITVRALATAGYRVRAAPDGDSAIALLSGDLGPVDLLVTDVVMPGTGGREVARAFQERHPGARVLFVSGYTQEAIDRHGILDAGTSFLPKPFTPAQLLARVRAVLDNP